MTMMTIQSQVGTVILSLGAHADSTASRPALGSVTVKSHLDIGTESSRPELQPIRL